MPQKSFSHWPLSSASPSSVGLCPQRLDRAAAYLEKLIANRTLAGAISLVARRGHLAHLRCYGWQDVEQNIPMREDAIFRIYSMTKPIVCVGILMLYEECALGLQDPVKRFLPEFADLKVAVKKPNGETKLVPLRRDITIHDLLTHTGGLSYALAMDFCKNGKNTADFVSAFCKEPLVHQPGEKWEYSSSNDILGCVIEVISGQTLDVFLEERIFRPLGMVDTAFWVPPERQHRFTVLYEHDANAQIVRRNTEDMTYLEKPAFFSGGGGLVSTTCDYLRFAMMLLGGGALGNTRLLSPKTVELMRQDHLPLGHPLIEPFKLRYGYGVSVVTSLAEKQNICSVGEFGWGGAAGTNTWIDPKEDMISMVLFQIKPSIVPMIDHIFKVGLTQAIVD